MKQYFKKLTICSLALANAYSSVPQNTKNTPHMPISHCYHWLDEATNNKKYLSHKYKFAQNNNGNITFYTEPGVTSKGAAAGPGLYCAKAPTGSYGYGDRVIRVDLVDDVVMYDAITGRQVCGVDGNFYATQAECDAKSWDIKFFRHGGIGNKAWYVIQNPQAIAQWSSNSQQVESDLTLNKPLGDHTFQMKVDATIRAMQAERARIGELVIVNHKARMNLLDVLNDPKEIAKIPPLSLILRVVKYTAPDLSAARKTTIYREQMKRALEDIYLGFSDFEAILKVESQLEGILVDEAKRVLVQKDLSKFNIIATVLTLDKYSSDPIGTTDITRVWKAIYKSDNVFESLNAYNFGNKDLINGMFLGLPPIEDFNKMKIRHQLEVLKLFNTYVSGRIQMMAARPYVREVINNYMTKSPEYVMSLYSDKIDNDMLGIKSTSKSLLMQKSSKDAFSGLSPIFIGNVLDHLKDEFTAEEFNKLSSELNQLPLIFDSEPTYKMLGQFMAKSFTLPSFMSESEFFLLLTERSVRERAAGDKNATNTFRFVLSAYFEHYINQVKYAKDDTARDLIKKKAEKVFIDLADNLPAPLDKSYKYAAFQNASYFALDGRNYDVHPTEGYYEKYKTGDANFDQRLEELTADAFDGSYLHYLIYTGIDRKEKNAKKLLNIFLDSLLSDEYANYRKSNEFKVANKEKSKWRNFIDNRHIQNAGRNRTRSDFCGIALVLAKFDSTLEDELKASKKSALDKIVDEAVNDGCKVKKR